MKRTDLATGLVWTLILVVPFHALAAAVSPQDAPTQKTSLTKNEYTVLKICEGIVQLFTQEPDAVWPGFNLARTPFVVYIPGKWALLLNRAQPVEGFSPYPADWPALGSPALYHQGQYKDLIGQLAFDFEIDSLKTVAIGFPEENLDSMVQAEAALFGGYVHEAFHQYQSAAFGEIPWEREERYPILDRENTALAYVEMRLLTDAVTMISAGDSAACRDDVAQFVALRNYRWEHGNSFVARYEQGQEINEGTARYTEMKAIQQMKTLQYHSSLDGLTSPLQQDLASISFPEYLINDLRERMTDNSILPEDMPRNRIYPVGSAEGFLLDYFRIEWKAKAQEAGPGVTFSQLLTEGLGLQKDHLDELLVRAKARYGYDRVISSTDRVIEAYVQEYEKALASFEEQPGYRVQIEFAARSLSRSRASLSKKWVVDGGARALCPLYQVYTLKNNEISLQLQNTGVWEWSDWDAKSYAVTFFVPENPAISLDGEPFTPADTTSHPFQKIELGDSNCWFNGSKAGVISSHGRHVSIKLSP
jgi:hypothetical protein